jgi:5-methylcytosine-specific restriction endonuclease McrA
MNKSEAGKLGGAASIATSNAKRAANIKHYLENPTLCKWCGKVIDYDRRKYTFCSHSCAIKLTNNRLGTGKPKSDKLTLEKIRDNREQKILSGSYTDRYYLKRYLIDLRGHKCEDCLLTDWKVSPIPLELDHIDGNAGNNLPSNLRLLCPNCHAMTPTAHGRNRGNGRKSRGLPLN